MMKKNNHVLHTGAHLWKSRSGGDGHGEMGDVGVRNPRTGGTAGTGLCSPCQLHVTHRARAILICDVAPKYG